MLVNFGALSMSRQGQESIHMLGGETIAASAVTHARELLKGAKREAVGNRRRAV